MDHPYYPLGVAIPNYRPNDLPLSRSLPVFGALIGAVVVSAYLLAGSGSGSGRRVRPIDRFAASWFALCKLFSFMCAEFSLDTWLIAETLGTGGFLHIAFEGWCSYCRENIISLHHISVVSNSSHIGYYILYRTSISSKNTLFAQLWKEYTLSDSRYLTSDIFTVCVETITVVSHFFYP